MNYIDRLAHDIAALVEPGRLPDEETFGLFRLYAVLALAKGSNVQASDVHDAWVAWRSEREPNHRSNVPFADLSLEKRAMDEPFVEAIRAVAHDRVPVGLD